MDASELTKLRRQRQLFANKVIQQTFFEKGYTNRVVIESSVSNNATDYPWNTSVAAGPTITTLEDQQRYKNEVPNRYPDPPTFIVATGSGGSATVYYTPPLYGGLFPIDYYLITVKPTNQQIKVTQNPATVSNLEPGIAYTFTIQAHNEAGFSDSSIPSDPINVIGIPSTPTNISAIRGNNQATVSFTPSSSNGGATIQSYTVVASPGNISVSGSSSPIVVPNLVNGVSYTFTVYATNANGNSPNAIPSAPITPATVPDPPTDVTGIRGNSSATVQFTPPASNGGSPITSYTVTSSPGGFTATGTSSPLIISGLTNGTQYTFTAVATNIVGNSVSSAVSNITTPATVPNSPTGIIATTGNTQATVSFTAPISNGGSTITSYIVTSSPSGLTATGGSSPITVTGLTNGVTYTFTVVAVNGIGNSSPSVSSNTVTPAGGVVPSSPTDVQAIPGNNAATISFSPSALGSPTSYTITASPGGLTITGSTSPLTLTGLTNGTQYTFNIVATNGSGDSAISISNQITAGAPLAPILTSSCPFVTEIAQSLTQPSNGTSRVTNYLYSLNGGPFTALSPATAISPITIQGLSPNTTYTITVRARNSNGDSLSSNSVLVKTYTTVNIQSFTTVGNSTWTAPPGVTAVQYLVVAGGGGGGGCYSSIILLGDVPFTNSNPGGPTTYWINKSPGTFYGYLFQGGRFAQIPSAVQMSCTAIINNVPPVITPSGITYPYNKFYADQIVYWSISGMANTTNYMPPFQINTTYCNNISAGSGGGAGGQVKVLTGCNFYTVVPGTTYNIVVGNGGAAGTASANTETIGQTGGNSSFDTIISTGGSGGNFSRGSQKTTNGFNKGGGGTFGPGILGGGGGGEGASAGFVETNYGLTNRGARGGSGRYIDFFGTGYTFYGDGGSGGKPNTPVTGQAVANIGVGGSGTGATLNSFASGQAGGSGIVVLKWYT